MMIAIAYALATGLGYSLNSVVMRYYVQTVGFTVLQLNIDGFAVMALCLLGMFYVTEV